MGNIVPLANRCYINDIAYYSNAAWLYKTLVKLLNPDESKRIVSMGDADHGYDETAPYWVEVNVIDDLVTWRCHCPYNQWYADGELPVFKFDINQYKDALNSLRTIVETGE